MKVTVAEPQGGRREVGAERSGMQTFDRRNTNRQRGRMRAASVLGNAKPQTHQDASSRVGRHEGTVYVLTQGDLPSESGAEVSRGHSSDEAARKRRRAKDPRNDGQAPCHPVSGANQAPTSAARREESRNAARTNPAPMVQPSQGAKGEHNPPPHAEDTNEKARPENLMEQAISSGNWAAALHAVMRNDGAPGPDGMTAEELGTHLEKHGEGIKVKLLQGRFKPAAARRKDIPKPNGDTRPLSIPNVLERFVQHMLQQALAPLFEPTFSDSSHGFRPGRSAHGAIEAAQKHAHEGHTWVVDIDITKFFDRVNHDILMRRLADKVKDKRVLKLIGRFLRAGVVMPDGCQVSSEEGTPQGGPLSPLLANIYLDALDKELERRGLRHVRYADDCNIYVSSQRAAQRVQEVISAWITKHLRLEVNESKSGTGRVWERKFLGFIFTMALLIGISPGSLAKFKDEVRAKWDARQAKSSEHLRDQWKSYLQGWWGYYGKVEERKSIIACSGWIRRHMRKCFWQRWHNAAGRRAALKRLKVPTSRLDIAHSSRGAWRMGRHPVIQEALSNRTLKRYGLITPSELAGKDPHVANRRMRKTARPVV